LYYVYQVEQYQISGQDALTGNRYDILAKAAGAAPVSQLRLMLQQLLADRFKLSLRRDTKSLPIHALTVAKGGPRLPAVKNDDGYHAVERLPRIQNDSFLFQDTSMPEFAAKLTILRGIDRPVVDKTGITGFFDIALKSAPSAMLQENGPSLFTLIQEQLGLKLVPEKAPGGSSRHRSCGETIGELMRGSAGGFAVHSTRITVAVVPVPGSS